MNWPLPKPRPMLVNFCVRGCVPLQSATAGEVRYYSIKRSANGMVMLTTFGRSVRVVVVQTAAPTAEYKRYLKRTVFTVRA